MFSSKLPRILILYNNMKKHVHSDPRSIAAHSLHSYKITITSPSIVALANIQIQNDTPFPAQWPADKLLPEGNSTREHGSTHTHTHTHNYSDLLTFCTFAPTLCSAQTFFNPPLFSFLSILTLFLSLSLSLASRKPHRMWSVSAAGMIGQWEAGCHRTLTHSERSRRETRRWGQWKSKVSRSLGRPVST